jgi:hypothetical protein
MSIMNSKKQLYQLDNIGFVGTQKKVLAIVRKRIEQKTGDIIRAAKVEAALMSKAK